jgi:hypothetical protein
MTYSKDWQMGLHQIINFHTAKETVTRMNRQATQWEKIFADIYLTMD